MKLELNDDEILAMDGRCTTHIQAVVDTIKRQRDHSDALSGLSPEQAQFVRSVVQTAVTDGRLAFVYTRLRYCSLCRKTAGYAKYPRSGRNHRKGDTNLSKPLSMGGVDLKNSFVHIEGHAALGCCKECWASVSDVVRQELAGVSAEVPESIMGCQPKWKWWHNSKCTACGWEGHEGEMRPIRTLMGDGFYPGGCPNCDAENSLFITKIKNRDGWSLVLREQEAAKEGT